MKTYKFLLHRDYIVNIDAKNEKENPLWNDYKKVIEDSIEHSFIKAINDLAYLEENYLADGAFSLIN